MLSFNDAKEYVEYLLRNYHYIKNDIEQMQIELEFYEVETKEETIEGMSVGNIEYKASYSSSNICDKTSSIALVYKNINDRLNTQNKDKLRKQILATQIELKKLDTAIGYLIDDTKNVIEDLYIKRLKWEQIAIRRYISNNTINRHRKKGIEEIARSFCNSKYVA